MQEIPQTCERCRTEFLLPPETPDHCWCPSCGAPHVTILAAECAAGVTDQGFSDLRKAAGDPGGPPYPTLSNNQEASPDLATNPSRKIEPRERPGDRWTKQMAALEEGTAPATIEHPGMQKLQGTPSEVIAATPTIPVGTNASLTFQCPSCARALRVNALETYDWKPGPCPYCQTVIAPPVVNAPAVFAPRAKPAPKSPPPKEKILRPDRDRAKFNFRSPRRNDQGRNTPVPQ